MNTRFFPDVRGQGVGLVLADCASIIFGIIGAKKHNFLNEHCHGIISKF